MVHHDSTVVEYDSFKSQLNVEAVQNFLEPLAVDANLKTIAVADED